MGPTLDPCDSLDSFDALDAEAPEGRGGGDLELMSWGHCRCIRFIRFGRGSESNESNESKIAPRTVAADTTPDSRASDSDASNGSTASQVLALGPTLDSLNSFGSLDSDQGPNLMNLMNRNWGPGLSIQTPPESGASESDESNGSNASQVLALGPTFNASAAFDADPGPNRLHLMTLKSAPRPGLEIQSIR